MKNFKIFAILKRKFGKNVFSLTEKIDFHVYREMFVHFLSSAIYWVIFCFISVFFWNLQFAVNLIKHQPFFNFKKFN